MFISFDIPPIGASCVSAGVEPSDFVVVGVYCWVAGIAGWPPVLNATGVLNVWSLICDGLSPATAIAVSRPAFLLTGGGAVGGFSLALFLDSTI